MYQCFNIEYVMNNLSMFYDGEPTMLSYHCQRQYCRCHAVCVHFACICGMDWPGVSP